MSNRRIRRGLEFGARIWNVGMVESRFLESIRMSSPDSLGKGTALVRRPALYICLPYLRPKNVRAEGVHVTPRQYRAVTWSANPIRAVEYKASLGVMTDRCHIRDFFGLVNHYFLDLTEHF